MLPEYKESSIVNLMASISKALGKKTEYNPLKILTDKEIKNNQNIVLIIIDGLGYNYIKRNAKDTILEKNLLGHMTSVFPATTAAAITTFFTGTEPIKHSVTGWFMNLKELGMTSTILPFIPRLGGISFSEFGIEPSDIITSKPLFKNLSSKKYFITIDHIKDSEYSVAMTPDAKRIGCKNIKSFFSQINKAINENKNSRKKTFMHCYWPIFDSISHEFGTNSKEAKKYLNEIIINLENFLKNANKSNTKIILTADHGVLDTHENKKVISMDNHPKLLETLSMPLSGEPRAAFCYVHTDKKKEFEKYVKNKLNKYCIMKSREQVLKDKIFGIKKANSKIHSRIGDYILLMKDNYLLRDSLLKQEPSKHIGNHGGISEDEMKVPIITFDLNQKIIK